MTFFERDITKTDSDIESKCSMQEVVDVSDPEEQAGFCQAEVWAKNNLGKWYKIKSMGLGLYITLNLFTGSNLRL